jgi:hypothetical protein
MNNNAYPVQYAFPQAPPAYDELELNDYEMARLLSETQPQPQVNANIVYYNPVETAAQPVPVINAAPNQVYLTNYSTPVVINAPAIIVQPAVIQVPEQTVRVCHRRFGGCNRNLSPQEYWAYRSAAFLKFHLFILLVLVIAFFIVTMGYDIYGSMLLAPHLIMLICGMIGAKRRSAPTLILLLIWLSFILIMCILCYIGSSLRYRLNSVSIIFGLNTFFTFVAIINTISLLTKIRRCRTQVRPTN